MATWLKASTAIEIKVGPFVNSVDGVTAETGLTITSAEVLLAKNAGDWTAKTEATSLVHESNGWYRCLLDATDTNTLGILLLQIAESGALPVWKEFMVIAANVYDSLVGGGDLLDVSVVQIDGDVQSATDLKDFADAGYDPATNKVQGLVLADTLTTYTGNTVQTGDSFARIGLPAGASVSADLLVIDNLVDDLESRLGTPSNLGGGATISANLSDIEAQTDDIGVAGAGLTALSTQVSVNDLPTNAELATALGTADDAVLTEVALVKAKTDNLPTDPADQSLIIAATDAIMTRLGLPAGASVSADIAAIEAQTDDIGVAGAGLTAVPWNAAWDAQVESEVADALAAYNAATGTDVPSAADVADAVWDEVIADHLDAGTTGAALNGAGAAGDPWGTALPGAYGAGSAGQILGDNLNATVDSRATQTSVDDIPTNAESAASLAAADDAVLAQVALVKAKTDNLPTDPADQSLIIAATDALATAIDALPTNAELATGFGTADDANLAALATALAQILAAIPTAIENADVLLKRDWTAVSAPASRSALNALRFIRNSFDTQSVPGFVLVTTEDDTTEAYRKALVTDAAAQPIVKG